MINAIKKIITAFWILISIVLLISFESMIAGPIYFFFKATKFICIEIAIVSKNIEEFLWDVIIEKVLYQLDISYSKFEELIIDHRIEEIINKDKENLN